MRKGKGGKKESSTIPFSGPALVNYSASVPWVYELQWLQC